MSIVSGAFNISAIVDGTNGVAYSILTNAESWQQTGSGFSPSALTWRYSISEGDSTKVLTTPSEAYAAGLTPKYAINGGDITAVTTSFSVNIYSSYTSITIYLYKGDVCVAEKTVSVTYGVAYTLQQYYLSTSCTELVGGSWSSSAPTAVPGMYIWVRNYTKYTDGSSSYSEAVCLSTPRAVNKLKNGEVEVSNSSPATSEMINYIPYAPLVAGKKYRITFCATFQPVTTWVGVLMSWGYTTKAVIEPKEFNTPVVYSVVFTAGYYSGREPGDEPESYIERGIDYSAIGLYQNIYGSNVGTYGAFTIHWARVDVCLVSESKMYALSTSRTIAPTSGWQSTSPTSVAGTYIWEKTIQYYDDDTQAETGIVCLQGATGAKMRMRDWAAGTSYLCGAAGEEYYDIVIYNSLLYRCIVSHSTTIYPTNTSYWQVATDWKFVATELLLARLIKAEEIDVANLVAQKVKAGFMAFKTISYGGSMDNYTLGYGAGDYTLPAINGEFREVKFFAPQLTRSLVEIVVSINTSSEDSQDDRIMYQDSTGAVTVATSVTLGSNKLYTFSSVPIASGGDYDGEYYWFVSAQELITL